MYRDFTKNLKSILLLSVFVCMSIAAYSQLATPAGVLAEPSYAKCKPTMLYTAGDVNQNVFGTDKNFASLCKLVQVFEMPANNTYNIAGVVVWVGNLKVNGTAGKIGFNVVDFCGFTGLTWASKQAGYTTPNQYSPDFTIGTGTTKQTSELTSSKCLDNANVVLFPTPIKVDKNATCVDKFGIEIDLSQIGDDVFGVYSTNLNQGSMGTGNVYKEFSWQYDSGTDAWYTVLGTTSGAINADMLIFPIIDKTAYTASPKTNVCDGSSSSIDENESFINGIKIGELYPNPASTVTTLDYQIENNSDVAVTIYDMTGKKVAFYDEGNKQAGSHSIKVDVSKLESGKYICMLSANGAMLNKIINVAKN